MLEWLRRRRRPRRPAPTITPRSEAEEIVRVELAELVPSVEVLLGRVGYLSLVLVENLGSALLHAPTTAAKAALAPALAEALDAHRATVDEMERRGLDPVAAMDPSRELLDGFQHLTRGRAWAETVVTCYLTAGFLTDFHRALAAGLREPLGRRIEQVLHLTTGEQVLVALLREQIDADPLLASRLALWGRRLIGDTILVARDALARDGVLPQEERTEPAFAELVAAHTRRMDALGLTA